MGRENARRERFLGYARNDTVHSQEGAESQKSRQDPSTALGTGAGMLRPTGANQQIIRQRTLPIF